MDIKSRVIKVIVDQLNNGDSDGIELPTRFYEDLGADSLDMVELEIALEEEFEDLTLTTEEVAHCRTVEDVINSVTWTLDRN